MTPVILMTDGYIANGSEPWKFPKSADLKDIKVEFEGPRHSEDAPFMPYARDERLVRKIRRKSRSIARHSHKNQL